MSIQCKRCYWISCKEGHQDGICKDCLNELNIEHLERQLAEARELIKAVAHIGIDWGYGKFELTQEHIDKARKLYEQQLKEQG